MSLISFRLHLIQGLTNALIKIYFEDEITNVSNHKIKHELFLKKTDDRKDNFNCSDKLTE